MARQEKAKTIKHADNHGAQAAEKLVAVQTSELKPGDPSVGPAAFEKPDDLKAVYLAASVKAIRQKQVSRTEQLLALLGRRQGATNAEMLQLTGWQPHSLRAALSGLRKKGHVLGRDHDRARQLRYRLIKRLETSAVANR